MKPPNWTILVILAMAVAVAGCPKPTNGIVGHWQSARTIGAVTSRVKYTFDENGRYSSEVVVSSKLGNLTTLESGTYVVSAGRISLTRVEATVNGAAIVRKTPLIDVRTYRLNGDNLVLDDHRVDKVLLTRTNT